MKHEVKILPEFFSEVKIGKKNFELRNNDRNYKAGDLLILKEWDRGNYTGRELTRRIQYVYRGDGNYGLAEGYCVLGLAGGHVRKNLKS